MTTYLVHLDFSGKPIGVWSSPTENYYSDTNHSLFTSAKNLLSNDVGEPWSDLTERLASRISHRDWWEVYESDATDLIKVWQEIVPSSAPLLDA